MIRAVKRHFALRAYAKRLSLDLVRRFGTKALYSIDHVTQAVERGEYDKAYLAFAHAMFCGRDDFEAYYGALNLKSTYDGLRRTIADKFLDGRIDFDASTLIRRAKGTALAGGQFQTEESDLA